MATYSRYASWGRKAATPTPLVPLKPPVDPEHLTPTEDDPDRYGNALWQESAPGAPYLPDDMVAVPVGSPVGGGGPVDHTPEDHSYGVGVSPGLTQAESRALMLPWHEDDQGAVAARQWQPTTDRQPGEGPHAAVLYDTPGDGDSPETLQYERTGVGQSIDPFARVGKRIKRWWDRYIDMHRYGVEYRPMVIRNAYTGREQPPVPDGTQLDSPWPTPGPFRATADAFVNPQLRRTPSPWDEPLTTDGMGTSELGATVWGL